MAHRCRARMLLRKSRDSVSYKDNRIGLDVGYKFELVTVDLIEVAESSKEPCGEWMNTYLDEVVYSRAMMYCGEIPASRIYSAA